MATYRENGLVAELVAIQQEAQAIGDQSFIGRASDIVNSVKSAWFPIVSGPINKAAAELLASDMATASGRPNCLDQPEAPTDVQPSGVPEPAQGDEQVAAGDVGANVSALLGDLKSSSSSGLSALSTLILVVAAIVIVAVVVRR